MLIASGIPAANLAAVRFNTAKLNITCIYDAHFHGCETKVYLCPYSSLLPR